MKHKYHKYGMKGVAKKKAKSHTKKYGTKHAKKK